MLFHTVHGVPLERIVVWVAISSSCGLHFTRTLHYDSSIFGGLQGIANNLFELCKPLHHDKVVIREGIKKDYEI